MGTAGRLQGGTRGSLGPRSAPHPKGTASPGCSSHGPKERRRCPAADGHRSCPGTAEPPRRCPLGRVTALGDLHPLQWCDTATAPKLPRTPDPQHCPCSLISPPPHNLCLPPPHRLLPPSLSPPLSDAPSTFRPRGGRHKPCFFQRPRLNTVSDPSWRGRPRVGNKPGRTRRAIKDAAKQKSSGYLADWL